jgi:hypothetical protein
MDDRIAAIAIVGNIAFFGSVTFLVWQWMKHRHERQLGGGSAAELEGLREEVRRLREDVEPQIAELTERLDFAERLLANVPRAPQIDKPVTTPV